MGSFPNLHKPNKHHEARSSRLYRRHAHRNDNCCPCPNNHLGNRSRSHLSLSLPLLSVPVALPLPQPFLEQKNCSWQEPFLQPKLKTLRMEEFSVYISNDHPI